MSSFTVQDLGILDYLSAVEVQRQKLEGILAATEPETLLLVEHPSILTLGANFHAENLLYTEDWYKVAGTSIFHSDRGGDVTYHGPGQLVAYPIFSLENRDKDLHRWLRSLEEVVIECLSQVGVAGIQFPPHTGVWVGNRKVCAMGIKVRKWVSMHGLALNCNPDLKAFESIVPCGIAEYGVTSLSVEACRNVTVSEMKPILIEAFHRRFG